jgi:hypothetical protein
MANVRRNVDSSAGPRAAPSPARTPTLASAAHCPIAANDLEQRSSPRSRRRAGRPASAGHRAAFAGPEPGKEIEQVRAARAAWAKVSSAAGDPSRPTMVSVRTSIVPRGPRPPPRGHAGPFTLCYDIAGHSLIHDFAVSLPVAPSPGIRRLAPAGRNGTSDSRDYAGCGFRIITAISASSSRRRARPCQRSHRLIWSTRRGPR